MQDDPHSCVGGAGSQLVSIVRMHQFRKEACTARLCSHTFSVGLNPHTFSVAHLQCGHTFRCSHTFSVGLNPDLDGADLGRCWCRQRETFRQRQLSRPYAWKSLLKVSLAWSFAFSLFRPEACATRLCSLA